MAKDTALSLTLEDSPGTSISWCAAEAIHVANTLQITVYFVFNDLRVMARPGEWVAIVQDRYMRAHEARQQQPEANG